MLTPDLNHWGLGPQVGGSGAHPYFSHGGADEGYQANLVAYNEGDGAVIMTNSDNGGRLAAEIVRSVAREYSWPDFQPVERTTVKLEPKALDAYVGGYRSSAGVFRITREGDQLFYQLARQQKLPLFPEAERKFFLKAVDVQVSVQIDSQGKATQLSHHQNGIDLPAVRMDDAELAEAARRYKDQKQAPGSEAVLRRLIEEWRIGQPDYSRMSPLVADVIRNELSDTKSAIGSLGSLQSLTYKGVDTTGLDIYNAKFENGLAEFRIGLMPDGKIEDVETRLL
jgi:hypothetical protein